MYKIKINENNEVFFCDSFITTKYGYKFNNVIKLTLPNGLPISYTEFKGKQYISNRVKSKCGTLKIDDTQISVIEVDGSELDLYLFDTDIIKKKPWWKL